MKINTTLLHLKVRVSLKLRLLGRRCVINVLFSDILVTHAHNDVQQPPQNARNDILMGGGDSEAVEAQDAYHSSLHLMKFAESNTVTNFSQFRRKSLHCNVRVQEHSKCMSYLGLLSHLYTNICCRKSVAIFSVDRRVSFARDLSVHRK